MGYSTTLDVETWGQIQDQDFGSLGYDYDSTLEYLIDLADRAIDDYCDQPSGYFEAGGVEIHLEYHGGVETGYHGLYPGMSNFSFFGVRRRPKLRLDYTPVLSVVSVEEETSADTWTTRTEGRDDDYLVMTDGIRFIRNIPKYDYDNIRITYIAGYQTTPGRVKECSARLSAAMAHRLVDARRRAPASVSGASATPPEGSMVAGVVFTRDLKDLVRNYRRHVPVKVVHQ